MSSYCLKFLAAISFFVIQTQSKEKQSIKDLGHNLHNYPIALDSPNLKRCFVPVRSKRCIVGAPKFYFNGVKCESTTCVHREAFKTLEDCEKTCITEGLRGKRPKLFTVVFSICN